MIIVLRQRPEPAALAALTDRVKSLGMTAHVIEGTERTVIAATGSESEAHHDALASEPGVEQVLPILAPYKIASRETKADPTVVSVGSLSIGGPLGKNGPGVIAGPCSVESEAQILESARVVKAAGATALRGGAFKPRTSPYSFQGMKQKGLELLAAAREETGLAVVTEVMAPGDVDLVAEWADVLQIGARNMQNYPLLEACGDRGAPVLLKRGPSATLDEFLLAAEYVLSRGNPHVMLCERGVRTFEAHTRFTLPLATVPYLHERTHLPVVIDPSHGTGVASLVPPMMAAATACGADGLIVEVHPDPPNAASDGPQSLTPAAFAAAMDTVRKVAAALA